MLNKSIKLSICVFTIVVIAVFFSCKKEDSSTNLQIETENLESALSMDTALHHAQTYHDSVVYAHTHAPAHQAHYDSIYHHYDSTYHHHHIIYHHHDTVHHHSGFHHTQIQHNTHDTLHNHHHSQFH